MEAALLSMNEVLFCGLNQLNGHARSKVTEHVMDRDFWAKLIKRKQSVEPPAHAPAHAHAHATAGASSLAVPRAGIPHSSTALVPHPSSSNQLAVKKKSFQIPRAGKDGPRGSMNGLTAVLTGVFPGI